MSEQHKGGQGHDPANDEAQGLGIAGGMARFFIQSPLSPVLFLAMLALGILGLIVTPRQEDPQISVPMVDIFVGYPGASSQQVARLAIDPLQRMMSEIPKVEHVYAAAQRDQGMVTVQFEVGEQLGPSLVKVHDKIQSNLDKIPPGVRPPLVRPKGIDDVPAVTLTLWSPDVDDGALRMLALDILQRLKEIPDTGTGFIVGGRTEQIRVEVMPERLSGFGLSLDQVAQTIETANSEVQAGMVEANSLDFTVYSGAFLRSAEDVSRLVVGTRNNTPVYVRDIANVIEGPEEPRQLVSYYTGPAYYGDEHTVANGQPAVTIAIAKKEGSNGVTVAEAVVRKVEALKGRLIPPNVKVEITRDYGKTANAKVNELIFKLFVATGVVTLLVIFALGVRPAVVVTLVIPVVILVTVFAAFLMGYTIDRVSLFALIFAIGILVDDAIVVVENIYRRWLMRGETDVPTAVDAVREVGNPTILATFTVIAALMPMGFVSGMMGPYMEPIPALGSVAMLVSLIAAFAFTPYLVLWLKPSLSALHTAEQKEHKEQARIGRVFDRLLTPLIESRAKGKMFLIGLVVVFFMACALIYTTAVTVKMLPYDNKPEFSVVLDMPEGSALYVTAAAVKQMAEAVRKMEEVTALQTYVGTAQPFDFNGMVRHYYLRDKPWQAELHVQLVDKHERKRSSHALALAARGVLKPIADKFGATITVVEMPPGPPVLQAVAAEIYGPDARTRRQVAADLTRVFNDIDSLADVDSYLQGQYDVWRFEVDTEKAVRRGISVDAINRNLTMAMGGYRAGDVKKGTVLEPTYIVLQIPLAVRAQIARLSDLPITAGDGATVPLAELGRFVRAPQDQPIYYKDVRPVEYVVADVVGRLAAPIYGMFDIEDKLAEINYTTPDGVKLEGLYTGPPEDDAVSSFEWAGEWTVTYETFRDMGIAFGAALILIYILVIWEFGNFMVPLVIMAPIPLTLIGIIPGHLLVGAEFTATSMIGFIALAGIIVRNSILLVDFTVQQIRDGMDVRHAVVSACQARTRPILITAFALVGGSSVILFDPIFQGMAVSLLFGVLVSTVLTLIVIPLGCISAGESMRAIAFAGMDLSEQLAHEHVAHAVGEAPRSVEATRPVVESKKQKSGDGPLMMVFYAIRGILLLIGSSLAGLLKRRKKGKAPPSPKPTVEPEPMPRARVQPESRTSASRPEPATVAPRRSAEPAPRALRPAAHEDVELEDDEVMTAIAEVEIETVDMLDEDAPRSTRTGAPKRRGIRLKKPKGE
ncbi:MAG: efflux RND transporter permease subunit [Gammaproteobacteria bacterium]|nr:efflux RND transporter permease subunit [Gammaproteobacteria bacterium]